MGKVARIAQEGQLKRCPRCEQTKPLEDYNKGNGQFGRRSICRECEHIIQNSPERVKRRRELEKLRRLNSEYVKRRNESDTKRRHINIKHTIWVYARMRALKKGIEFDITEDDFDLVEYCPLLGIKLEMSKGKAKDNSYSLDRIDNSKGYIKGNVWIISKKANALKGNASLDELELLVNNLRKYWIH